MENYAIIADIGGTNARFATINESGEMSDVKCFKIIEFDSVIDAFNSYVDNLKTKERPKAAAFAFAGPIVNDEIKLLNAKWSFSLTETGDLLGLDYFTVVNDFVAQAFAIPDIDEKDKIKIGDYGHTADACPIAVIGAGTGLGVSCLIPDEDDFIAIPTEAGHITASGVGEKEEFVISYLYKKYNHVSFERVVSAQGLENIYAALSFFSTGEEIAINSMDIFEKAKKKDQLALETFDLFFSFLGREAGNIALTYGALGGVYLSGGILTNPDVIKMLKDSRFRSSFDEKGRFKDYLQTIPTYAISAENVGLRGLKNMMIEYFENNA